MTAAQVAAPENEVATKTIPRVDEPPIIGSTLKFRDDQGAFVREAHAKHGDVVSARIGPDLWYFVRDPEIVHTINVRRWKEFRKPVLNKRIFHLFLGDGLVPNDGDHWRRQHDMIKPGFHRPRIQAYGPTFVEYAERMVKRFAEGERRDIRKEINNLALEIVGETLFGADMANDTNVVFKAMHDLSEILVEHIHLPLPMPRWFPTKGNRRKIDAIEALEGVIKWLIAERRAEGKDRGDLLSHIIFAKDKKGLGMNSKELRDEAMTLLFAGHETTAHAMTWAWYLLAQNPDKAQKMYDEIMQVVGHRPMAVEDLDELPYVAQVVKESLRVMPSVWMYAREPLHDVVIKGYKFPKGAQIFISPLILNHDPRWHPNPERFEPERWTRTYERGLPKGAYVPFAAGPRVCLGQGFAQMEMKLVLGTMIQNLVPKLAAGFDPDIVYELSMHPGIRGMQIEVEIRPDAPLFQGGTTETEQAA